MSTGCGGKNENSPATQHAATNSRERVSPQQDDEIEHAASDVMSRAAQLLEDGDIDAASSLVSSHLIERPNDNAALVLSSRIAIAKGKLETAIELAEPVPADSADGFAATELLVPLYLKANSPDKAVTRLQATLDGNDLPDRKSATLRQQLWTILNRLGRRQEASIQADSLCRAGYVNRPLLISLLRRNDSFPLAIDADQLSKNFYPGMGIARWYFSHEDTKRAIDELQKESRVNVGSEASRAFLGRLLAETQATDEFLTWFGSCNQETSRFSEYWIALGIYFFDQGQFTESRPSAFGSRIH